MKKYSVTFHYSVEIEAEDEAMAEEQAWSKFGNPEPKSNDDFVCIVNEMIDIWAKTDMGNYTCADCEDPVSEEAVLGNRKYGEPRCEGCYFDARYRA